MKDFPILLDDNEKPLAILQNSFDVILSDEVMTKSTGSETLDFKIPYKDKKRQLITNEDKVLCHNRIFIIRIVDDDESTSYYTTVSCEALWYEIANGAPITSCSLKTVDAKTLLDFILKDSGWKAGVIEPTCKRTLEVTEPINRLQAVRQLPILYECELYFDTLNKTVNLLNRIGKETNTVISYAYNSDSIKRNCDSRDIKTRVYLYGKDKLNIKDINKGFDYVENFSYYDELGKKHVIKSTIINDDRFTNPNALKEYGENYLKENCRPKYSYQVKVYLLKGNIGLGDSVIIYDKDLGIKGYMRIVSRKLNLLEQEKSEVELDNKLKNFTDQMAENSLGSNSDIADTTNTGLNEVSMFNLLLNSRADYGFNYWINRGFEIDNTSGCTGKASFKCVGELDKEKSMSQEVDVSNREAYTISAQVEINDIIQNPSSQVGFEITLEYDDGTTETKFISII